MALIITFKDGKEYIWNVGVKEIKNKAPLTLHYLKDNVDLVSISGDEKIYIESKYSNIPIYNGSFCVYAKEIATFISLNLSIEICIL